MANPLFNALGNGGAPVGNIMGMLQQFKQNPMQFLIQRKLNVPQGIANDPNAILQHLVSSGQINQQQINNAYQMMGQFKR